MKTNTKSVEAAGKFWNSNKNSNHPSLNITFFTKPYHQVNKDNCLDTACNSRGKPAVL